MLNQGRASHYPITLTMTDGSTLVVHIVSDECTPESLVIIDEAGERSIPRNSVRSSRITIGRDALDTIAA